MIGPYIIVICKDVLEFPIHQKFFYEFSLFNELEQNYHPYHIGDNTSIILKMVVKKCIKQIT